MTQQNRYTSFEFFMKEVISTAQTQCSLEEVYQISNVQVISYCLIIIGLGWVILGTIVPLLLMSWVGFLGALILFLANPIGLLLIGVFGVATTSILKTLYENKQFPIAVHQVGEHFREKYHAISRDTSSPEVQTKERIDSLFDSAVLMLILKPEVYLQQKK